MKSRALFPFLITFSLAAASAPGPAPRFDAWKIMGPGGGGTMIAPTVSPHDFNIVVEHCDMTGAYITLDSARSWRMFNLRGGVSTFAFDPRNSKVIYAGNSALWRSEDTGRSWSMILPDPKRHTVEHQLGDHSEYKLTTDDPVYPSGFNVTNIAVDPAATNRIYVALNGRPSMDTARPAPLTSVILVSEDRGMTWARKEAFEGRSVLAMIPDAAGLVIVLDDSVLRESGANREEFPLPQRFAKVSSGRVNDSQALRIYATSKPGSLYVSEDGGRTWRAATPQFGQTSGRFEAITASERNPLTAYAGFRNLKLGPGRENTFNGIAKTTDGGRNWSIVHKESNQPSANLEPSWLETRARDGGENIWFDSPYDLGAAPANPDICYATDLFRTYRTLDGGKTWQQVNSVRMGEDRWTTRGLDVTTNYGVHFDPFDVKHMFIGYTDIGAFQSYDGGSSWTTATVGVPQRWRNTTYWIQFDPKVKGLMWGAFSGVHDLPRPKMFRGRDPERYHGGVGISTDGGKFWKVSNTGMPETSVTHILLDPTSPVGSRTLYACSFGRGVFKSTDNGKTWTLKNAGIEEKKPFAWRITRAANGTLYLVIARANEGRYADTTGSGALYKSTDGAASWVRIKLPENCNGPVGLTLDPKDNRRMYLSAWGRGREDFDIGGGVFLSTDGGASWRQVFKESQHVYDVTVDPKNPKVLYACGFDAAAFRSADGGETWTRIKGFNFKWGHRVILDPVNPAMIYITTYGGSVWHGPATGDPAAIDDILTPVALHD